MKTNPLLTKLFGAVTISAVMIIGVYVLILDLPKIKDENSSMTTDTSISNDNSSKNQSNETRVTEKDSESSGTVITTPSAPNNTPTSPSSPSTPTTPTTPATPTTPTTPTAPTPTFAYRDGAILKSVTYDYYKSSGYQGRVAGQWVLYATITIKDDVVIGVSTDEKSTTNQPVSGESANYYNDFAAQVITIKGKKINTLNIGTLGGATYTSAAFNNILDQVRAASKK